MRLRLKTAGCDPEVLFVDNTGFRSVEGLLPGTKDEPHKVFGGAVHVDNVAAEFGTRPAPNGGYFNRVVDRVYTQMCAILGDLTPTPTGAAGYPDTELQTPTALHAGCDPDWNAYTMQLNPPADYTGTNIRCAGGHVHFGTNADEAREVKLLTQAADLIITIPMIEHEDSTRRQIYGKAGSFRPKPYGFEYRTPSNLWIFTEQRRRWMFERMQEVAAVGLDTRVPREVQDIINGHDVRGSSELVSALNLTPFPA